MNFLVDTKIMHFLHPQNQGVRRCKKEVKIPYKGSIDPTIQVFTITNGSYKTERWWKQFAKLSNKHDTINFSVDGYDQKSNDLYRVNSH